MAAAKTGMGTPEMTNDLESIAFERSKEGVVISQAGGSYKCGESANSKGNVALRGWALRTETRKSPKYGDHTAMIVRLTKPTIVIDAKGDKRVQTEGEVDITMVKKLEPYQAIFEHEELVSEVEIYPTHKEKLANGHDLWHFEFRVLQVVPRSKLASADIEALAGLLNGEGAAKALPASA